jgi:type IV pilus assembly protein PilP
MRAVIVPALSVALLSPALHAQTAPAGQPPAANAQQPAQPKPPAPPAEQAPRGAAGPPLPPQEAYTYQPEGRRDPFLSLVGVGTEQRTTVKKADGIAGLTVAEISVRGILQSRGSLLAMVAGPDNKTYIVHPGDKLLDGTIKTITTQGLVIIQEVNDPLSLVKQREVTKLLRGIEGAKE